MLEGSGVIRYARSGGRYRCGIVSSAAFSGLSDGRTSSSYARPGEKQSRAESAG